MTFSVDEGINPFKVGENTHKIIKIITLSNWGLMIF